LVQSLGRDAVELGEIGVEDRTLATDGVDDAFN
jgi:hypothetical protein